MTADVGPAAEGVRVPWAMVPAQVHAAVDEMCGSPVVAATTQAGGFSPGAAVRVVCADGRRWFVKAIAADSHPGAYAAHRREAVVLAGLAPLVRSGRLRVPLLHADTTQGEWAAMVMSDVDGRQPALPWRRAELELAVAAVDALAEALTPTPIDATLAVDELVDAFCGWRTLAADPARAASLDAWSRTNLDRLATIEAGWPEHLHGTTLLHADLRADNMLVTADGVVVVDWPWACVGAPLLDVVGFAPSVAMQGGPLPQELLAMTAAGRAASPDAVLSLACALAGYFTEVSLRPVESGLPTVREFQAAQGVVARRWVAEMLAGS